MTNGKIHCLWIFLYIITVMLCWLQQIVLLLSSIIILTLKYSINVIWMELIRKILWYSHGVILTSFFTSLFFHLPERIGNTVLSSTESALSCKTYRIMTGYSHLLILEWVFFEMTTEKFILIPNIHIFLQ